MRIVRYVTLRRSVTTTAADGGHATITFPPLDQSGLFAEIERIAFDIAANTQTPAFALYENAIDPTNLLDYTNTANLAIADESSPARIDAGSQLVARWDQVDLGATVSLRLQIRIVDPRDVAPGSAASPDAGGPYAPAQGPGMG